MKRVLYIIKEFLLITIACVGGWVLTKLEGVNKTKLTKRIVGELVVMNVITVTVGYDNTIAHRAGKTFIERYLNAFAVELCAVGFLVILIVLVMSVMWLFGAFEDDNDDDSIGDII